MVRPCTSTVVKTRARWFRSQWAGVSSSNWLHPHHSGNQFATHVVPSAIIFVGVVAWPLVMQIRQFEFINAFWVRCFFGEMMIFSFRNYFGCCSSYLSYDPYFTHYIFGRSKTNHDQIDGTWWHNIGEIRPWIETFMRQYFSYVFGRNMVRLQTRSQCLDENARPVSEMDILKFKVRRLPVTVYRNSWHVPEDLSWFNQGIYPYRNCFHAPTSPDFLQFGACLTVLRLCFRGVSPHHVPSMAPVSDRSELHVRAVRRRTPHRPPLSPENPGVGEREDQPLAPCHNRTSSGFKWKLETCAKVCFTLSSRNTLW